MRSDLLLGAIADDFTGGSDLAGMLAGQGVRTQQTFGIPDEAALEAARDSEAVVVSLKTRSIAAADAVSASLSALAALRRLSPRQLQFKYCSTFDSTRHGNIGPVASALMSALETEFTVAVPALPVNGRTQYLGYLFVNGLLLSESSLRTHPLNPMTEPNLVRHLQPQTNRKVGLIDLHAVRTGGIRRDSDVEIALVDAIGDADLRSIAGAVADMPLITGGSGIGYALPDVWKERGDWNPQTPLSVSVVRKQRRTLMLAGSCSTATLAQIAEWQGASESMRVADLGSGELERLLSLCKDRLHECGSVLVYSSADLAGRTPGASASIEHAFGSLAHQLLPCYDQIVVAGGETSGAVVEALGVRAVRVGPAIDPGVPALRAVAGPPMALALKSGNFGSRNFFAKAAHRLLSV